MERHIGGTTRLYVGHEELASAADTLAGFQANLDDEREVVFGTFGRDSGGGAVALKLTCIDRAGHCDLAYDTRIGSPPQRFAVRSSRVVWRCRTRALGRFMDQMKILNSSLTGSAVLHFA